MTILFQDQRITLYHGDFREVFGELDLQGHVAICDPPYGQTTLPWDTWVADWPNSLLARVTHFWCFGTFRMFLDHGEEFSDWNFSQDIIFEKANGSEIRNDRFRRVHEFAVQFYRGPWEKIYTNVPRQTSGRGPRARNRQAQPSHQGVIGPHRYESDGTVLQCSVISEPPGTPRVRLPSFKPPWMVAPLIRYSCPPGGIVLDPFAGVGGVLETAQLLGVRAIGCEIDKERAEHAAIRLGQQLILPL